MKGKQALLQKVIMEKNKQFDNIIKYSMAGDIKYLEKIEEFYREINDLDMELKDGMFANILEDFDACISGSREITVSNILNLYGKLYSVVENIDGELSNGVYKKCKSNQVEISSKKSIEKILIIDDDILFLKMIEENLEKRGYNTILCSNPFEAIKCLNEENISLVVLDMILPGIDGFKMTKIIRDIDPILPIIIISSKNDLETKINVLKIGADDYITKPINMEEFYARIDRTLDRTTNYNALSIKDGLTGVYTKEYFWERAKEKMALYNRNKETFSIAFVDIDDFKTVNDNLGHLVGDKILKCFARILKNTLRSTDLIFRFGGDEFIIIFPETREMEAKLVLERFNRTKRCSKCGNEQCITVTNVNFSAGITEIKSAEDTVEKMIGRADKALYDAKGNGGNGIFIYEEKISYGYF
ncbi:putative Diguanylate cyclase [[Clostridium] ultunense Esp]|uniref:Putative Diguanylate cyclase n=1 Tax=[Clostridium] ultunense Esp TaxID=1288971 RepID=M1ZFA5_9FIRM|nr:diguanylate cyclase [Schnuerera ultunensis]CCQ96798.1 putative Diguanylate cyclase [[Clostridium] ultunense Esp]SHD75562.1 putative Diguanylate cyclase [[Clostridium] ultunense Esp]